MATGKLEALLADLRDNPVSQASDNILHPLFTYLINVQPDAADKKYHWFCDRAAQLTIEAASFLLRLYAYNSALVTTWKTRFSKCVVECAACVKGLQEARHASRSTYFGAFSDEVMLGFNRSFDDWELDLVVKAVSQSGVMSGTENVEKLGLNKLSPAVIYHMVANVRILLEPQILSFLCACPAISAWPVDPPPPGLFLLVMHDRSDVRQWARTQISHCTAVPIPKEKFITGHNTAVELIATHMTSILAVGDSMPEFITTHSSIANGDVTQQSSFPFTTNLLDLWGGFCVVLRHLPYELLLAGPGHPTDFRRIVTGHLHDAGPHFVEIFRCLLFLLKRVKENLWQGEGPEYPLVVFDAIKDNSSYLELLQHVDPTVDKAWFLSWFAEYLVSIQDSAVFGEILAKIIDFLCEELQHERFQEARPTIMLAAIRLLSSLFRSKIEIGDAAKRRAAVMAVMDIHSEIFTSVAFGRPYSDVKWKNTRSAARDLINSTLLQDVHDVISAIGVLSTTSPPDVSIPSPSLRTQMWKKAYGTIQINDADGMVALIGTIAMSAHVDSLAAQAFLHSALNNKKQSQAVDPIQKALGDINSSLCVMRDGFLDVMSKFANYNSATFILDVLRRPDVAKHIMILMLSPVEDLQVAAQTIVGQAFDVDVRLDCFRAVLENLPGASLEGIFESLERFIQYAPLVPEACSLSKSLVRCFTDIIEVLCSSHDGLIHKDIFLKSQDKEGPAAQIPRLWSLMSKSIAVIFKKTPSWSIYFPSEEMVVWMRDALIFGRDMLAQRMALESAAVSVSNQKSSLQAGNSTQLSRIGKKMVNDLQEVLPELARWLRLTDEELLHQSFALLQSLLECFRENRIPPSPAGLAKLNKHVTDARKQGPDSPQTRLDSSRLSKLENSLAAFDASDSDDEIQLISHKAAPKTKPVETKAKPPLGKGAVQLQPPKVPASTSLSKPTFTEKDQRTLNAAKSFPTFRRSENIQAPSGIKPSVSSSRQQESSSEDSSSDQGESQGGLAALTNFQRSPKIKKPAERRQVKMLDVTNQASKAAAERLSRRDDARRTALRLRPDISGLHRALLSWDYDYSGPTFALLGNNARLQHVPDVFSDHQQYRAVFEPLLLMECWSQIVQSKEEEKAEIHECKISSRHFVDYWLDIEISISESVQKDWYLGDTDIVLLKHLDGKRSILAKTQSYKANFLGIQATLRCSANITDPGLEINTTWQLKKVFSLSTLHREYAALVALPYYDFYDSIIKPQLSAIPTVSTQELRETMSAFGLNEPQAKAILGSMLTDGFSLIQGPPGTGKTSTICGLIETFLERRPRPTTAVHVGRPSAPVEKAPIKKVLLCAPSNAAVDEVANRIKEGSRGTKRRSTPIKVIRVGAEKALNISVKDISLDYLVEQSISSTKDAKDPPKEAGNEIAVLKAEIESVKRAKQQKLGELNTVHDNGARIALLEEDIKKLNARRMALTQQFDRLKDKQKSDSRTVDAARRKLRIELLQDSDVICSTLSGAGHDLLEQLDFEMVIIDEAAQAIELSSLIPLKFRCRRCIMVGDPQQLPPTVLSQDATKYNYNQSLFVRMQKHRPEAVHLLSIQYRMHPDISQLPSRLFYHGRLQDGPDMATKTKQPWHSHVKFGTYRFFNITRGLEESANGHSLKNRQECQAAVALYARLRQEFGSIDLDYRIGIVSMYRGQVLELQRTFQQRFGRDIISKIYFHTVDGFQGQEKDIIILSCVRAGPGLQSVGFLSDVRRMNVAITRAKSSLFILGNIATLERSDANWKSIIDDARSRFFLTDADSTFFTTPNTIAPRVPLPAPKVIKQQPFINTANKAPDDLTTPRNLAASVSHKSPHSISPLKAKASERITPIKPAQTQRSRLSSPNGEIEPHQPDEKGSVPELTRRDSAASDIPDRSFKLRPPKRQKKDKGNIFIPKKKNKPSVGEGGLGGPSNVKR